MNVDVTAPPDVLQRLLQITELLDSSTSPSPLALAEVVTELREIARELPPLAATLRRTQLEQAVEHGLNLRLRYQELLDSAPDGYLVLDRFGVIQEANHAAADLLHGRREFIVGKPLAFFLAPDWRADFYGRLARPGGGAQRWEAVLQPPQGSPRFVEFTLALEADHTNETLPGFRCQLRDITERKQSELALRRERALVDSLTDAVEAVVLVVNASGRILRCNAYVLAAAGLSWEELRNRYWWELLDPADGSAAERMMYAINQSVTGAVAGGKPPNAAFGGVWRLAARNSTRPFAWSGRVLDELGQRPRFVILGHDISELQEAQERALKAERLAAIGQMAAALAHEGRNALQRTMACLAMLEMRVYENEEARDLILRAQKAQDDLLHLFEDVRIFAAPIRLELGLCDVAELWREAWMELGPAAAGAKLSEAIEGVDLHCLVCHFHMRQVFRNVLDNAVMATKGAGHVVIRAAETNVDGRDAVTIVVCDDGPGFAEAQREKAFEPFYTTKARGTGLGLAICKRLVEAHGGRMEIDPGDGPGARIVITLARRTT